MYQWCLIDNLWLLIVLLNEESWSDEDKAFKINLTKWISALSKSTWNSGNKKAWSENTHLTNWPILTWEWDLHDSNSLRVYLRRILAPGWKLAAPLWRDPSQAELASARTKWGICFLPPTPLLVLQPEINIPELVCPWHIVRYLWMTEST